MTAMAGESNADVVREMNKALLCFSPLPYLKFIACPTWKLGYQNDLSFPVVNMTKDALHVQFSTRKLVFMIILIACECSIKPSTHSFSV